MAAHPRPAWLHLPGHSGIIETGLVATGAGFHAYFWLALCVIAFPLSIALFVAAETPDMIGKSPPSFLGFGVCLALFSILSLVRFFTRRYFGIWITCCGAADDCGRCYWFQQRDVDGL